MGTEARTYSRVQRDEALALYVEHGGAEASRRLAARGLDVPAATIRKWAQRAGKTQARAEQGTARVEAARLTWAQRRSEIALRSGEGAAEFLERAIGTNASRSASEWMIAFEKAVRTAQLLDGGATGRVEFSESEVRAGVQRIRDELAARRERKQAAGA